MVTSGQGKGGRAEPPRGARAFRAGWCAALQALHWASAVSVAQLVELLVVVQAVAGSNPVAHPSDKSCKSAQSKLERLAPRVAQDANEVPKRRGTGRVGGHGAIIADITTWALVHLILGSIMALTGLGLLAGSSGARWAAGLFVTVNAIAQISGSPPPRCGRS